MLSANQAAFITAMEENVKTAFVAKITTNTSEWQVLNNPNAPTIINPNAGNAVGRVSQYGSVKPIVFNGEFTIAVTFNQQKGDV